VHKTIKLRTPPPCHMPFCSSGDVYLRCCSVRQCYWNFRSVIKRREYYALIDSRWVATLMDNASERSGKRINSKRAPHLGGVVAMAGMLGRGVRVLAGEPMAGAEARF
jgi:hypothetical protein